MVITINGENTIIASMNNIQTSASADSKKMRVVGTRKVQSKPNGTTLKGKGNIYYSATRTTAFTA